MLQFGLYSGTGLASHSRLTSTAQQLFLRVLLLMLFVESGWATASSSPKISPSRHPNIILITLDTTRADRMGFLGSKRGLTPNLDALARRSVIFSRAYAQVPLTTPSHATILTGTYPQFHQVNYMGDPLGKNLPYLPDILH
jgi:predicted AlkP superfamily pyrophosphatase or phosphodiesterase